MLSEKDKAGPGLERALGDASLPGMRTAPPTSRNSARCGIYRELTLLHGMRIVHHMWWYRYLSVWMWRSRYFLPSGVPHIR